MANLAELEKSMSELAPIRPLDEPASPQKPPQGTSSPSFMNKMLSLEADAPQVFDDPYGLDGLDGLFKSAGDRLGTEIASGSDPFETAARGQSGLDQAVNGVSKALITVGTTYVGGTVGAVNSLIQGLYNVADKDDTTTFMEGFINNEFNQGLDSLSETANELLPNFETRREQDAGAWQSLGYTNFWANQVANGAAFTIGALLTEATWSAATVATFGGAAAGQAIATANLARRAHRIFKGARKINKVIGAQKVGSALGQLGTMARQIYTGAGYEAGFESRHTYNQLVQEEVKRGQEKDPEFTKEDISPEKMEMIRTASNHLFAGNLALISASNFIAFGRTFKAPTINDARKALRSMGINYDAANKVASFRKRGVFEKVGLSGWVMGKGIISEGFIEEGGQSLMGRMASDYMNRKSDPKYQDDAFSVWEGFNRSLAEASGDNEFWKEVMVGSIIGFFGNAMSSPKAALKDNKFTQLTKVWKDSRPEELQGYVDRINAEGLEDFIEANIKDFALQSSLAQEMGESLMQGSKARQKDAEQMALFSYVYARNQMGLGSLIDQDIKNIAEMDLETFRESFYKGNPIEDKDLKERQEQVVKSITETVNLFNRAIDDIDAMFPMEQDAIREGLAYVFFDARKTGQRAGQVGERLSKLIDITEEKAEKMAAGVSLERLKKEYADVYKRIKKYYDLSKGKGKDKRFKKTKEEMKNASESEKAEREVLDQLKKELVKAISDAKLDRSYTPSKAREDALEGAPAEAMLDALVDQMEILETLAEDSSIPLAHKEEAQELLKDMIYLETKKNYMDKFLNQLYSAPKRKTFRDLLEKNEEEKKKYLIQAIAEGGAVINEDLEKGMNIAGMDVLRASLDKANEKLLEEEDPSKSNPLYHASAAMKAIGEMIRGRELLNKTLKDLEKAADLEVPGEVSTDSEEEELEEDPYVLRKEAEEGSFLPLWTGMKSFFRLNTLYSAYLNEDGTVKGEYLNEDGSVNIHKLEEAIDKIKGTREYTFMRALYSMHRAINGKEGSLLIDAQGNPVLSDAQGKVDPDAYKGLRWKSYSIHSKDRPDNIPEEAFTIETIEGTEPIVMVLEDSEGKQVFIGEKGELLPVYTWLPEASMTYPKKNEEDPLKLRFSFVRYFAKIFPRKKKTGGIPDLIQSYLDDPEKFVEVVEKSEESVHAPEEIKAIARAFRTYKEKRKELWESGENISIKMDFGDPFNPGVYTETAPKPQQLVGKDGVFKNAAELRKAIDNGDIDIHIIQTAKGKTKGGTSQGGKILGGKRVQRAGTVFISKDGGAWTINGAPLVDTEEETVYNLDKIFQAMHDSMEWAKNKKKKSPIRLDNISKEDFLGQDKDGHTPVNIMKYLKDQLGMITSVPPSNLVYDKNNNAILPEHLIGQVEEKGYMYITNTFKREDSDSIDIETGEKKDPKGTGFSRQSFGYRIHYRDPNTGKYTVSTVTELAGKSPIRDTKEKISEEKAKEYKLKGDALIRKLIRSAVDKNTGEAASRRHSIILQDPKKGFDNRVNMISGVDSKTGKILFDREMSIADYYFTGDVPRATVYGDPPKYVPNPTIDDQILGIQRDNETGALTGTKAPFKSQSINLISPWESAPAQKRTFAAGQVIDADVQDVEEGGPVSSPKEGETGELGEALAAGQTTAYEKAGIEAKRKSDKDTAKTIPKDRYTTVQGEPKDLLAKFREYLTDVLGWEHMAISYANGHLILEWEYGEIRVPAKIHHLAGATSNIDIDINNVIDARYDMYLESLPGKKDQGKDDTEDDDITGGFGDFGISRVSRGGEKSRPSLSWIKKVFPNIESVYKDLEEGIDGLFTKGRVLISPFAAEGTEYHEGFHVFARGILTPRQYELLMKSTRKDLGDSMITTQEGKKIVYIKATEATDIQIEEYLAEEFRTYMMSSGQYRFPSRPRKNLFQKIWDAIKKLFGLSDNPYMSREEMFSRLNGDVSFNINREAFSQEELYRISSGHRKHLNAFHKKFFELLSRKEAMITGEAFFDLSTVLEKGAESSIFDELKGLFEQAGEMLQDRADSKSTSSKDKAKILAVISGLQEVLDNYEDIVQTYRNALEKLSMEQFEDLIKSTEERETAKQNVDFVETSTVRASDRLGKPLKLYLLSKYDIDKMRKLKGRLVNMLKDSPSIEIMLQKLQDHISISPENDPYSKVYKSIIEDFQNPSTKYMAKLRRMFKSDFGQYETTPMTATMGSGAPVESAVRIALRNRIQNDWIYNATTEARTFEAKSKKSGKKSPFLVYERDGKLYFDGSKFYDEATGEPLIKEDTVIKDFQNLGRLFANIGLTLSYEELEDNLKDFENFARYLAKNLEEARNAKEDLPFLSLFYDEGSITGQASDFLKIAEALSESRPEVVELSIFRADNKQIYTIGLGTYLHRVNSFAAAGLTDYDTPLKVRSRLYQAMKRGEIKVANTNGLRATWTDSSVFRKLDSKTQLTLQIEHLLNGQVFLSPDDRSTPFMLDMGGNMISPKVENKSMEEQYLDYMKDLLRTEMYQFKEYNENKDFHTKNLGQHLSNGLYMFSDFNKGERAEIENGNLAETLLVKSPEEIISNNEIAINAYFQGHLAGRKEALHNSLMEKSLVQEVIDEEGNPDALDILFDYRSLAKALGLKESAVAHRENSTVISLPLPEGEKSFPELYHQMLDYIAMNTQAINIDMTNVLNGSVAAYKDVLDWVKRNNRTTSTQKSGAWDDISIADMDENYIRTDLVEGEDRKQLRTITISEPTKVIQDRISKVMDAFSLMNFNSYRDVRISIGRWSQAMEMLFQYDQQQAFLYGIKTRGKIKGTMFTPENFNKIFRGHAVFKSVDQPSTFGGGTDISPSTGGVFKSLQDLSPEKIHPYKEILPEDLTEALVIEKPHAQGKLTFEKGGQEIGIIENWNLKSALGPMLFRRAFDNKEAATLKEAEKDREVNYDQAQLVLDMMENQIDLIQPPSSNKGDMMVDKNGEGPALFELDENGKLLYNSTLPGHKKEGYVGKASQEDVGIQQDPAGDKKTLKWSIQYISQVRAGLLQKMKKALQELEEKEASEEEISKAREEYQKYLDKSHKVEAAFNKIRSNKKKRLWKDLGVEKGVIPKKNFYKVERVLLESINNEYTPEETRNTVKALLRDLDIEHLNLDYSSMGPRLSQVLTSIVESQVIDFQVEGAGLVQVPNITERDTLKFYDVKEENGKVVSIGRAEIKRSATPQEQDYIVRKYGSLYEFNLLIKKLKTDPKAIDPIDQKVLLEFMANRIPTSGLGLIESLTVAEFLPSWNGKQIVLPDGLIEKAGSDFDIDKLQAYFNAKEILEEGENVRIVSFYIEDVDEKASIEDLKDLYAVTYQSIKDLKRKVNSKKELSSTEVQKLFKERMVEEISRALSSASLKSLAEISALPEGPLQDSDRAKLKQVLTELEIKELKDEGIEKNFEGMSYGDIFPDKYIINGLNRVFSDFLMHEKNKDEFLSPLGMGTFEKLLEDKNKDKTPLTPLEAMDILWQSRKRYDLLSAEDDLGVTASSLTVEGILSSLNMSIGTIVPSPFSDMEGDMLIGPKGHNGDNTLSNASDQLLQGQLEMAKNPVLAELGLTGVASNIFLSMMKFSPGGITPDMDLVLNFLTSDTVIDILEGAKSNASRIQQIKDKGSHRSFTKGLKIEATGGDKKKTLWELVAGEKEDYEQRRNDLEVFRNYINSPGKGISLSNLSDIDELIAASEESQEILEEGDVDLRSQAADILFLYYMLSDQLRTLNTLIYQDQSTGSGATELHSRERRKKMFKHYDNPSDLNSNKVFLLQDVDQFIYNSRNKEVASITAELDGLLMSMRMIGSHEKITQRIDSINDRLPNTRNKESNKRKVELGFLAWIVQNYHPDIRKNGYDQILTDKLVDSLQRMKEDNPTHPLFSVVFPQKNRRYGEDKEESLVNSILSPLRTIDIAEQDAIHEYLLENPELMKNLVMADMMRSGFSYQSIGLGPIIPDSGRMEVFLPAFKGFMDHMKSEAMTVEDVDSIMNKFEQTFMAQNQIARNNAIVPHASTFKRILTVGQMQALQDKRIGVVPKAVEDFKHTKVMDTSLRQLKGPGLKDLIAVPGSRAVHITMDLFDIDLKINNRQFTKLRRIEAAELRDMIKDPEDLEYIDFPPGSRFAKDKDGNNIYIREELMGDIDFLALEADTEAYYTKNLKNTVKRSKRSSKRISVDPAGEATYTKDTASKNLHNIGRAVAPSAPSEASREASVEKIVTIQVQGEAVRAARREMSDGSIVWLKLDSKEDLVMEDGKYVILANGQTEKEEPLYYVFCRTK